MTEAQQERHQWRVTGMDCAACTLKVSRALSRLPGVHNVDVALLSERLSLDLEPDTTAAGEVEALVRRLGYGIDNSGPAAGAVRQSDQQDQHGCASDHDCQGHDADEGHRHDHAHGHSHSHSHGGPGGAGHWYQGAHGRLLIVTGLLLLLAWGFSALTSAAVGFWGFVAACLLGLFPVARRALAALRLGQPFTIEGLMSVAALGALMIGAAEEAALVVFLFALGEVLEGIAANRARDGIRALADLVPKLALLEQEGELREVPADQLQPGQIVMVRPGDRLPADAEIIEGSSALDESPVTGESLPVARSVGDPVLAGSINVEAVLRLRVTSPAAENTISRIIRLVEEAEASRAPTERFIDRFSRWYMPLIVAVAALVIVIPPLLFAQDWQVWIYRGLALLLIGCPCALVISVPAAIAAVLSVGARRGLLMKGGAVVETAARLRHVAFDKTGTLTAGRPQIVDILPEPDLPDLPEPNLPESDLAAGDLAAGDPQTLEAGERRLLAIAGAVETGSSHPLAQALLLRLAQQGQSALAAREAKVLPGRGVEAMVTLGPGDARRISVSSPQYAAGQGGLSIAGSARATALEAEGKTVVAVYADARPLGLIAFRDELRPDAADATRQLAALGVGATMLTGDNPRVAAAIAAELGLDFQAGMLPEDKLVAIRALAQDGPVMMIGDGINDAPALKQADVGVAMGAGTDVALETADAALLRNNVLDVVALIRLARAGMRNIRQNIALALGLKAVFLVTSVLGITGLWIAVLADTGATVLVTLNALRLLAYDPGRGR